MLGTFGNEKVAHRFDFIATWFFFHFLHSKNIAVKSRETKRNCWVQFEQKK